MLKKIMFLLVIWVFVGFSSYAEINHAQIAPPAVVKNVKVALFKNNIFYVSPVGSDSNEGTIDKPFKTLSMALSKALPGDIIFLREGIYDIDVEIDKSGHPNNPITIQSYPNERAIFDGSKYDHSNQVKFRISGSWLKIKDIEVRNGPSDGILITDGAGFNVLENITVHHNYFAGIELENGAHHNIIRNCDSYRNFDYGESHGEHADGFGVKFNVGVGNIITGCRAWENSDDGFDLWSAGNSVVIEYSWAWRNGFDLWGVGKEFAGDGNGFKLGSGSPLIHHCISWGNAHGGFDFNDVSDVEKVFNNTSYNNPDYGFKFSWGQHLLRNNLSFMDGGNFIGSDVNDEYNSWNGSLIEVSAKDFKSLDDKVAIGPRRKGGGLPISDFLRPSKNSRLIDRGVDVGLFFYGNAPDIGGFESLYERTR